MSKIGERFDASKKMCWGKIKSLNESSGTGFRAGETITIEHDDTEVATATVKTDGTFSAIFKVPRSQYGDHDITVSDGTTTGG